MIAVSGLVMHGSESDAPSTVTNKKPEEHPRVYSQSFVLVKDEEAVKATSKSNGKLAPDALSAQQFYIRTDTMRFVG